MDLMREHNTSAIAEMRVLRDAVAQFTRELKASGLPPERALVLVRTETARIVGLLPDLERPSDAIKLAADLVQEALRAYYAA
jgi:hypothetical protein